MAWKRPLDMMSPAAIYARQRDAFVFLYRMPDELLLA